MGLLAGFDRDSWEPFALLGMERAVADRPARERRRILDRFKGSDYERQAFTVVVVLAAEADKEWAAANPPKVEAGEGGFLIRLLDWMAAHKEFIEWLIALFAGFSGAPT